MKRQRVTIEEVFEAGRQQGFSALDDVDMIIIETTGDLTIIEKDIEGRKSTVGNIARKR